MRSCICGYAQRTIPVLVHCAAPNRRFCIGLHRYIKGMRMSGEWISAIELRAAAIVFGFNIFVFSAHQKTPTWMPYRGERSDSKDSYWEQSSTLLDCSQ
ncbi:hypothetical protein L596_029257 [Steinernema carpocapsae]|uniref:Uncharacterized protein n=1 Tax=Steinernema carpocapsae TaxID=34508 RepID=A0A4U5LU48_STECR|nr:hypothetical protein L596_029257 [Steinernema carpocapsae]